MTDDEIVEMAKQQEWYEHESLSDREILGFANLIISRQKEIDCHALRSAFISVDGVCLTATQVQSLYEQFSAAIKRG
jgi:riboflavin synthase alpha subunit